MDHGLLRAAAERNAALRDALARARDAAEWIYARDTDALVEGLRAALDLAEAAIDELADELAEGVAVFSQDPDALATLNNVFDRSGTD